MLGSGSANGLDMKRFRPSTSAEVEEARKSLDLPVDAPVIAVVGRLTKDKGLHDLPGLWIRLSSMHPDAWLVVAGAAEPVDRMDEATLSAVRALDRVCMVGQVQDVERVFAATDVLIMLSVREGLGMVALEAGACGVPTIGYAVTGVVDAVLDGETGVLVRPGDLEAIADAASALIRDPGRASQLGAASALRAREIFAQEIVWSAWDELLCDQALPASHIRAR